MMYSLGTLNPTLSFYGGILAFIGVITFGLVLVMIVSLELSTRALRRQRPIPPPLSEELRENKKENESSLNEKE